MKIRRLRRIRTLGMVVAVIVGYSCLTARPAAADNMITLDVTGQVSNGSTTTSFTGQYQFDDTTDSIGAWSFDFSGFVQPVGGGGSIQFGTISGTTGTVTENADGTDTLDFFTSQFLGTDVQFNVNDPTDLVSNGQGSLFTVFELAVGPINNPLSSITVVQASPVPEPPSLFLLGTSLLALGPIARRFARA